MRLVYLPSFEPFSSVRHEQLFIRVHLNCYADAEQARIAIAGLTRNPGPIVREFRGHSNR